MVGDSYEDDIEGRARSGSGRSCSIATGSCPTRRIGSTRCSRCRRRSASPTPSSRRQASVCAPSGTSTAGSVEPNSAPPRPASRPGRRRRPRRRSARASPRACAAKTPRAPPRARPGPRRTDARRAPASLDELAEPPEELRLERTDRQLAAVGGPVEAVAREPAREHARDGLASEPVRDEVVRAVGHRDDDARAASRTRAFEERREHLRDRAERSGREIGDLDRRQLGRGVLEHARPAEVVDVVPGALLVASVVRTR